MENGKDFKSPDLTKREPSKMLHPYCVQCAKDVDGFLYHREGHTDGTPILTLRCHGASITIGASIEGALEFRKQMEQIYITGLAKIFWKHDGTINGPTETAYTSKSAYSNHGAGSGTDLGSFQNKTPRVSRDEPDFSF